VIAAISGATPREGNEVDRDLVERARRGDREAFTVLVHQVSDVLYAVAYRILRDSGLAEDALQNALVLAWRRLPHLREADRFEAWIHRILVHACYDESQRTRSWTATSGSCPSTGHRPRTGAMPSPLIQTHKMAEAAAVDEATGSLNTLREQFAAKYALPACP
jgi:DNA-directed RNA polymerase specialized sigma24 family protein